MKSMYGVVASGAVALLALQTSGVSADKSHQKFVPTKADALFLEQFTPGWESRWATSKSSKLQRGTEEFKYDGVWSVEEPTVFPGLAGDEGLTMKSKAKQHAISTLFDEPITFDGKEPFVVQYEVKMQNGLSCGGAYIKLLRSDGNELSTESFGDTTPYTIMFGPDRCGPDNKLHFIFHHRNPKTGKYEEKQLKIPPHAKVSKVSALYTLIVNPDNTFDIQVDQESVLKGNLLEDFTPPVNPPKEIDDPTDKKPASWVDEAEIPDPKAKKPADWDEDAPRMIRDPNAKKPSDWYEDEPLMIPDPEAVQPEEWDVEEDGEWVAPPVVNPKCEDAAGCGPWTPPMVSNPNYRGKWTPPMIANPKYKGEWAPRKIANKDYFEDAHPNRFAPIGGVGFELWTMDDGILFDNIFIGRDPKEAERFAAETFRVKLPLEQNREVETQKKDPEYDVGHNVPSVAERVLKQLNHRTSVLVKRLSTEQDKLAVLLSSKDIVGFYAAAVAVILGVVGLLASLLGSSAAKAPAAKAPAAKTAPKKKTEAPATAPAADAQDVAASATAWSVDKDANVTRRVGAKTA